MRKLGDVYRERIEKTNKGFKTSAGLFSYVKSNADLYTKSVKYRINWVGVTFKLLSPNAQNELILMRYELNTLNNDFLNNSLLAKPDNLLKFDDKEAKTLFDQLNAYRNKNRKLLNQYENIWKQNLKKDVPELFSNKAFKNIINKESADTIKNVVDLDSHLKTKLSDAIIARQKKIKFLKGRLIFLLF